MAVVQKGPKTKAGKELVSALEDELAYSLVQGEGMVRRKDREILAHTIITLVRSGVVRVEQEAMK